MKNFLHNTWKHRAHIVMALPAFLVLLFFAYIPMGGLVMAFKSYDYTKGIWGSPWNGLDNFKFLIASKSTFLSMTKNTLFYYVIFTGLGTVLNVVLAIAIDQCVFKKCAKTMQTVMIIPVFISYAAVQFIVYAFISTDTGILNNLFNARVRYYTTAGIDSSLYEAAEIDGANRWQQIVNITIPSLVPMITVMLLLSVGNIMRSDTGLFYQVTRNSGQLYSTTQVIDSYVLNAIFKNSNFGFVAATTFFQSVVGLLMMLLANGAVRKIAPENALF